MKSPTFFLTILAAYVFVVSAGTGCTTATENTPQAEPVFDLANAKNEIIAANKDFATFFNSQDSVRLAGLYSDDARFMMTGAPAFSGRKQIQSAMSGIMNSGVTGITLTTVDVWGSEGLVTEEGGYALSVGDTVVDEGKYLVLWKKENGQWHLFRDIFNSNLPAQ